MPGKQAKFAVILKGLNYDQNIIFPKLDQYIKIRKASYEERYNDQSIKHENYLPFNNYEGLCSGLTAYWLYLKRIGEEGKFIHKLHHIITWNEKEFAKTVAAANNPQDIKDPIIEEFMNHVFLIQHFSDIDINAQIHQINLGLNTIVDAKSIPAITKPEFDISFVFNRKSLTKLIEETMFENKMVRFENSFHTVGGLYQNGVYYYYDSSNKHGLRETTSAKEFAELVFSGLAAFCKSKDYIALNMSSFDLDGSTAANYPDPSEYCKNLFSNKKYAQAVLTHPNILRVGIRFDVPMLEWLFEQRFAPTAAKQTRQDVLNETVTGAETDIAKAEFLLLHGLDVNYRAKNAESALGRAIRLQLTKMLFFLLSHRADPNIIEQDEAPLDYAIRHDDGNKSIILLLAFGADPTELFIELLASYTCNKEYTEVIKKALELNKELVEKKLIEPNERNALVQARLDALLNKTPNPFAVNEKSNSLVKEIQSAVQTIMAKPLASRSAHEVMHITAFITDLAKLSKTPATANLNKIYIAHKAKRAKHALYEYLKPYKKNKLVFSKSSNVMNEDTEAVFNKEIKPLLRNSRY